MDSWSDIQLKKMQLGGNKKMNNFFKEHGISKETDIVTKYNSQAAEHFREKIKAEAEGREWKAPPVPLKKTSSSPMNKPPSGRPNKGGSMHKTKSVPDEWGWDEQDHEPEPAPSMKRSSSSNGPMNGTAAGHHRTASGGGGGNYTKEQMLDSASRKEDFFAQQMQRNAAKPEGLHPNQGGKYVGFGSGGGPPKREEADPMSALLGGFGRLTSSVAAQTTSLTRDLSAGKLMDSTTQLASQTANISRSGFSWIKGAVTSVDSMMSNVVGGGNAGATGADSPPRLYNPEGRTSTSQSSKFVGFEGGSGSGSNLTASGSGNFTGFGSSSSPGRGAAYGSNESTAAMKPPLATGSSSGSLRKQGLASSSAGLGSKNSLAADSANEKSSKSKDGWGDDWADDDWGR
eukprot:CAMPEP_0196594556 /NCGR_PEP_ID=MMETSP1081-20130531/78674_1 /TAXON_ID=36882 /ORGANISM="Pyramimonas amylifera, Strain CCMP720" /LENGTH=400 /DNA_ID=CAMNT_0041918851 /DNA_START=380 /DNA_END=1582 /DNA_ORIENTATION=-